MIIDSLNLPIWKHKLFLGIMCALWMGRWTEIFSTTLPLPSYKINSWQKKIALKWISQKLLRKNSRGKFAAIIVISKWMLPFGKLFDGSELKIPNDSKRTVSIGSVSGACGQFVRTKRPALFSCHWCLNAHRYVSVMWDLNDRLAFYRQSWWYVKIND